MKKNLYLSPASRELDILVEGVVCSSPGPDGSGEGHNWESPMMPLPLILD